MKKLLVLFIAISLILAAVAPAMAGGHGYPPARPAPMGYGHGGYHGGHGGGHHNNNDWIAPAAIIGGLAVLGAVINSTRSAPPPVAYPPQTCMNRALRCNGPYCQEVLVPGPCYP